ncbi:hypothetical protein ABL78_5209 [Leptomonas seymouri]|uniref:Uncharacterized protein n=1 Tax=Leptomonas seymouri TaxID=5684 RepID=A0A0N1PB35_LEPSE|nr:hypothetical protein ABL78_5209 [Leptomonas seymouri]|eukprot:KPI85722.1 hypothetical protein ABL78_5209 [Leptomonas seymouri]
MADVRPFVEELLSLKKQQATSLFGPWDVEDEGRIAVKQVRPLLLSVFPESAHAAPYLTVGRVKAAYESVTHRPWHTPPSVATVSYSPHHASHLPDLMHMGPTLDELHRVIDILASSSEETLSAASSPIQEDTTSFQPLLTHDHPFPTSDSSTRSRPAAQVGFDVESKVVSAAPVAALVKPCIQLLQGSIEHIYKTFCAACTQAGEPVPAVLPTDAAHLKRLAWAIGARHLQLGESYALHRLLASLPPADEVTQQGDEDAFASSIPQDAFVSLLCAL